MATAHDVTAYIIEKQGPVSAMKLQKLVYYSQAWSLVWDERPMFDEEIQAWANGPVVPDLYAVHKGQYMIDKWPLGDANKLDDLAKETVNAVLEFYWPMNAQQLSDITHHEEPWILARAGLAAGDRGTSVISHASMAEYYSGLEPSDQ
ncbi:MAG: Panacea domain-containing protein [Armatimonadota bacterium]